MRSHLLVFLRSRRSALLCRLAAKRCRSAKKEAAANSLLGFDPKQIHPPDPAKGQPLARVFDQYIYPSDVEATSPRLTDEQAEQLQGRILGPLADRYIRQKKIAVTAKEIDDFNKAMQRITAKPADPAARNPATRTRPHSTGKSPNTSSKSGNWTRPSTKNTAAP